MSHAIRASVAVPAATAEPDRLENPDYEGLITRAIAFALDAALINLVSILVAGVVALALSILSLPSKLDPVLVACGGAAYLLWTIAYFVTFWSTTGQTPGNRVMRLRVCMADTGRPPRPSRAVIRLGGLFLATIPFFAGFLPILVNDRRRGLQDMLADTVVVAAPDDPPVNGRAPSGRRG